VGCLRQARRPGSGRYGHAALRFRRGEFRGVLLMYRGLAVGCGPMTQRTRRNAGDTISISQPDLLITELFPFGRRTLEGRNSSPFLNRWQRRCACGPLDLRLGFRGYLRPRRQNRQGELQDELIAHTRARDQRCTRDARRHNPLSLPAGRVVTRVGKAKPALYEASADRPPRQPPRASARASTNEIRQRCGGDVGRMSLTPAPCSCLTPIHRVAFAACVKHRWRGAASN